MIQSHAYENIKKEGFEEGMQQGMSQGDLSGQLKRARKDVSDVLKARFDVIPISILQDIERVAMLPVLDDLHFKAVTVRDLQEFKLVLKKFLET